MRWIWAMLVFVLAACHLGAPPPHSGHEWQFTPVQGGQMWRFQFGDPVTSVVVQTVVAASAQVTDAGLEILLDEWGGNKSAKWTGLTGGQQDRARVWIDVQQPDGAWKRVFSGAMVRRPSRPLGEREAVGDKYLRLKEIPVELISSGGGPQGAGVDVGAAIRALAQAARADLPHLVVSGVPDAGVTGKRDHNGESMAAAFDGLLSLKSGWGWTTLPDDTLYLGPAPAREAVVNAALSGVQVELRDVVSEGLRNAIRWVYTLPDKRPVVYESRHATVTARGRSSVTRYIDSRSLPGVTENVAADYYAKPYDYPEQALGLTPDTYGFLRDGGASQTSVGIGEYLRVHLNAPADWTEVRVLPPGGAIEVVIQYSGSVNGEVRLKGTAYETVYLPALAAGDEVRIFPAVRPDSGAPGLAELNPRAFKRTLLDAAAADLYHIPAEHAGTASVLGLQSPAGSVRVQRPNLPDIVEKAVGTRYRIAQPIRTEYLIGEPDDPEDAQVLKVLIDRQDERAVDQAVNT